MLARVKAAVSIFHALLEATEQRTRRPGPSRSSVLTVEKTVPHARTGQLAEAKLRELSAGPRLVLSI